MEKVHEHAPLNADVIDATNWDWDKFDGMDPPSKTYQSLGPKMNC